MNWQNYQPENPVNPQDEFGLQHNEILDFSAANYSQLLSPPASRIEIINSFSELFVNRSFVYYPSDDNSKNRGQAYAYASACPIKFTSGQTEYWDLDMYTIDFKQIIESIFSVIENLNVGNVEEIILQLKQIDNNIEASALQIEEKTIAFRSNSVARFSVAYWSAQKGNPSTTWINFADKYNHEFGISQPPNWVYSDIKGVFISAIFAPCPVIPLASGALSSAMTAVTGWW
jgi:hypothetical protein